ncbi:thioredoxin domain-containing protein [Cystoisospora suis]|uniref:Thioredoxin domain-containing protein n=1 Tax=Cystoisospora suis TaxID=483139 RepID=A0A2C6L831_9APIC|nr:thioredoxin domain-containing protein [Cystoisospora suis]
MICVGPICLPVWQLGIIGAFLLKPLKDVAMLLYSRCCKHRSECTYTPSPALGEGHLELFRQSDEDLKRRQKERGDHREPAVVSIHSDDEMTSLKKRLIQEGKTKVLFVDFSATWCRPCQAIFPFLQALSVCYEGVFAKVDIDDCPDTAEEASIQALPTFCVYLLQTTTAEGRDPVKEEWRLIARAVGANRRDWENLVVLHAKPIGPAKTRDHEGSDLGSGDLHAKHQ